MNLYVIAGSVLIGLLYVKFYRTNTQEVHIQSDNPDEEPDIQHMEMEPSNSDYLIFGSLFAVLGAVLSSEEAIRIFPFLDRLRSNENNKLETTGIPSLQAYNSLGLLGPNGEARSLAPAAPAAPAAPSASTAPSAPSASLPEVRTAPSGSRAFENFGREVPKTGTPAF